MPTETEQRILDAIGALAIELKAQGERLAHVETELGSKLAHVETELKSQGEKLVHVETELRSQGEKLVHVESAITELRSELKAEVKRWDDRFFDFAKESANRANTFIGSAAIAVIGGVVLLILRM